MKIRKELWFGFILMALIIAGTAVMLLMAPKITNGHLGLMMLALVVVAIMLGFPTAFTLMGMGMIFTWFAYEENTSKTLTLMVQSAFKVMGNDVLISIPLFVFMGYLVERANLIEKLFKSLHLAMARVPGSLAVATLFTCAVFATATGIVGAVVTLMGLLALPQMLRGGYDVRVSAGAITAGGCLGILIPPSVMLIVYGATAGVSVVQLYAGAFFPGIMLAGLYVVYVIILAKIKPHLMPPLSAADRFVPLPALTEPISKQFSNTALPALLARVEGHAQSRGAHRLHPAPTRRGADPRGAVRAGHGLQLAPQHLACAHRRNLDDAEDGGRRDRARAGRKRRRAGRAAEGRRWPGRAAERRRRAGRTARRRWRREGAPPAPRATSRNPRPPTAA